MPQGKLIVALDGPAGAGKSTVSKRLAQRLQFALVDTGAIYRCIALAARRAGIQPQDNAKLTALVGSVKVGFAFMGGKNHVFLDGEDVTDAIRTPENSLAASTYSARPVVRQGLLGLQRRLALECEQPGAILEGRDIGTVVFPDADVKVFMTASVLKRAARRHAELAARGEAPPLEQVQREIEARDAQDSQRETAPLKKADDAVELDTTELSVDEIVEKIAAMVQQRQSAA